MSGWYEVAEAKQLPEGSMKGVEVGGTRVLLVHGPAGIRAFEDRCGHMSVPLSLGTMKSGVIKCALHAAVYDAETGTVRGEPQMGGARPGADKLPPEMLEAFAKMGQIMAQVRTEPIRPYPVAVENGRVMVHV
jgi:nitrite reductase/ring-hydroxylating ferredoxin subunit